MRLTVLVSDPIECSIGTDNCDPNAECSNTPGSFTCNQGYSGGGVNCISELYSILLLHPFLLKYRNPRVISDLLSLLLSLCSYRVNWGDGEPMEWFYGIDRPGPKNMDHVWHVQIANCPLQDTCWVWHWI